MLDVIYKFASGDLEARGTVADGDSALDGVMAGINILGEELEAYVAEHKRAEERLRSALLYARSLIEVSLDPLVTISVEGKIMDVNEAAVQVTGVPRDLLIGSDFSGYFTEPDKAHAGYREAFANGIIRNYPLTIRHVSGKLSEVLYNASVYRDEKGEVAGLCAEARDITDRKRAEQAEELASRDGLTGLYNHRTFYSFLKDEIVRAQRYDHPLSLLMLDIDHFKRVNDTHGHQAGDAILRGISDLLVKQARTTDRVCRYGGEEITVILPETDATVAMQIAERLRATVERHPFDIGGGKTAGIAVSIGVATNSRQVNSPKGLVKAADVALYTAKQGGRNRICPYETETAEGTHSPECVGDLDSRLRAPRWRRLLPSVQLKLSLESTRASVLETFAVWIFIRLRLHCLTELVHQGVHVVVGLRRDVDRHVGELHRQSPGRRHRIGTRIHLREHDVDGLRGVGLKGHRYRRKRDAIFQLFYYRILLPGLERSIDAFQDVPVDLRRQVDDLGVIDKFGAPLVPPNPVASIRLTGSLAA
ncbi:MAG: GGDEF domain-containing protein [Betaproteobacteria bacterium]|nr:GGDEF domain-containing protein [Betaproteobacteria bacterium]